MKFTSAIIENYRSIEELELDLSSEGNSFCRILAGINESGKSNVLKALSLLSAESSVTYSKDINKKAKFEKKDIRVRYILDPTSHSILKKQLLESGLTTEIVDAIEIKKIERVVSFNSASARSDLFWIYLKGQPSLANYAYSPTKKFFMAIPEEELESNDSSEAIPEDQETSPTTTAPTVTSVETPVVETALNLDTKEAWEKVLEDRYAKEALDSLMPRVIFWAYHDKYLINKEINLTDFSANPAQTSKPLHNVFNLAGYTDAQIPAAITDALEDGSLMGELADRLGGAATAYLEEVWPEHRVSLRVHPATPTITFHVVEKDTPAGGRYEIGERSDGFKHFFAILLNLAAENSTEQLKDCLILLDEPEVHLHPSGAKFLRDELLKIAKHNTVIYSTHSIFMIDRACLDRHYKIFKENETTRIIKIDSSNPFREELVYESLGTSIFELISEHNVLFEGLTDKKLFDAFTHKYRMDIKPLDINTMSVDGESQFDKYCKFFNNKSIRGYIVTDSDTAGVAAKTRILRENTNYTKENTFELNDVTQTNKQASLEDLLPLEVVQKLIEDFAGVTIVLDASKTLAAQLIDFNKNGAKKIEINKLKSFICDSVCDDITKSSMTKEKAKEKYPTYYEFVTSLHQKIKDANTKSES